MVSYKKAQVRKNEREQAQDQDYQQMVMREHLQAASKAPMGLDFG